MKKTCLLAGVCLAMLLCSCSAEVVWETVDDDIVPVAATMEKPYIITFGVPGDAVLEAWSESARSIYVQENGDYEILSDVISADSLDEAVQSVSGFRADELELLETTRFGLPEYQFAWVSATDEGGYVSRASLIEDENYYYALVFSVREELGSAYQDCAEAVFSSLGLHGDEEF